MKQITRYLIALFFITHSYAVLAGTLPPPPPPPPAPTLNVEQCNDLDANILDDVLQDGEGCSEIAQANTVIEGDSIRRSTVNTTNKLGSGIQSGLKGRSGNGLASNRSGIQRSSGLAAGDGFNNVSAWGTFTRTFADDDLISTAYDSTADNALFGVDFAPMQNMILGVALSLEQNDVETRFNNGTQNTDGFSVAPYIGYLITDSISVDASLGYGRFDIEQTRTDPASAAIVVGDTESDRWFISANLNAFTTHNNWLLSGRVGLVYAEEDQDGYAESSTSATAILNTAVASQTIHFGQFQIGGEAAYSFGELEPFVAAFYEHDFKQEKITVNAGQVTPSNDDDDIRFGAGVRYFSAGGFSSIVQWDTVLSRRNYDSHSINIMGRVEF